MHEKNALRNELIETTNYMFENELAWGNSGNVSARTSDREFLVTKSGTYLGNLMEDDFIEWETGREIDRSQSKRPSKEVPMHQAIYEQRPEIQAVLHATPFYSTIVANTSLTIPANSFVEGMYYLERVARIPYAHPGSKELGELVWEKAKETNVMLLENHGVIVFDTSLQEARMALHTLEFACKMAVTMQSQQVRINELPPGQVYDFLHYAGYKPRRKWER
ncbi:class II aldolase/adducin family protein [Evansella tamaricis]|uniref:Class II aldolase/adducin family protein n=1 Tax=Evansella tamaricis TaxID=2069301 RepID=A0ABS6JDA5_9BACI|nr:class II aldolase/adducin family protein [Evansella tamaricis]MBU9711661.1 class II aldolase/adducin family protein [Evansella tamaricis]